MPSSSSFLRNNRISVLYLFLLVYSPQEASQKPFGINGPNKEYFTRVTPATVDRFHFFPREKNICETIDFANTTVDHQRWLS